MPVRPKLAAALALAAAACAAAGSASAEPNLEGFWTVKLERNPSGKALIDELPKAAVLINDTGAGELAATPTSDSRRTWERTLGDGRFVRDASGGVRVDATVERRCPGRTLYTVEWANRPSPSWRSRPCRPVGDGGKDTPAGGVWCSGRTPRTTW